jgi:tryptophan-rich sensory protein
MMTQPGLIDVVTFVFVTTNACRLFAYLPQILAALRCRNGASAVSRVTWSYFAVAHLTGHVYSTVVLHDPRMASVLLGNFLACTALVAIVTWKKARHRAATSPAPKECAGAGA